MNFHRFPKRALFVGISAAAAVPILFILLAPVNTGGLASEPHPAGNYDEALRRIETFRAGDAGKADPACRTTLMSPGEKTGRAVVLFHGYTRCPLQFRNLGMALEQRGYTVYIPQLPRHGWTDRLTDDQARLTARELAACADEAIDVARGLGDTVIVAGFSMGGVMAAWAAQFRPDIEKAVIISPALGVGPVPARCTRAFVNLALILPNAWRWWDPDLKDRNISYGYPRYSTRALAEMIRLGFAVRSSARTRPPAARTVTVVTNPNDGAVNGAMIEDLLSAWRTTAADRVSTHVFGREMGMGHELFTPDIYDGRYDRVQAVLVDLIDR